MRIISKYRDYYDSAQGLGFDDSFVFLRKQEIVSDDIVKKFDDKFSYYRNGFWRDNFERVHGYNVCNAAMAEFNIVGFCGRFYPFIGLRVLYDDECGHIRHGKCCFLYSKEDLDTFVKSCSGKGLALIMKRVAPVSFRKKKGVKNLISFYDDCVSFFNILNDFEDSESFLRLGVPYFMYSINRNALVYDEYFDCDLFGSSLLGSGDSDKIFKNPTLLKIGFQKVFNPYFCHQEIEMFFNGPLCKRDSVEIDIPDDCMRDMKGFDKWSFRKKVR